jgi:hypothetical protein
MCNKLLTHKDSRIIHLEIAVNVASISSKINSKRQSFNIMKLNILIQFLCSLSEILNTGSESTVA